MLTAVACVLLSLAPSSFPSPYPARIAAVTVYPDRAEMMREAQLRVAAGAQEVLIGPWPAEMDDASLRVAGKGPAGIGLVFGDVEMRLVDGVEVRGPELTEAETRLGDLGQQPTALDDRLARIERMRELLGSLQIWTPSK